jgi:YtoQ family protein
MTKTWTVYLSGEIHSNWRETMETGAKEADLPVIFYAPNTVHADSDDCGAVILGEEENPYWRDHKAAKINAIRTRTLLEESDIIVVRFGEKYKQWNAAFDAGQAAAHGIPLIVQHMVEHTHALKEVDAAALATCETPEQVLEILSYVIMGELKR